jgi:hypothetical protein
MAAKVGAPVYGSIGESKKIFHGVSIRGLLYDNSRKSVRILCLLSAYQFADCFSCSDTSPANCFAQDTIRTPLNPQWVFDTQSAGWIVRYELFSSVECSYSTRQQWINATAAEELDHTSGSYAIVVPDTNLR